MGFYGSKNNSGIGLLWAYVLTLGVFLAASMAAPDASAIPVYGRYLVDTNFSTSNGATYTQYGNTGAGINPTAFDQNVNDSGLGKQVGTIKFDYDTIVGDATDGAGPITVGSAALAGGFFLGAGYKVIDGFSLHWVQTVLTTTSGATAQSVWGLPVTNAIRYPDAGSGGANSPVYPNESSPFGSPTLGFQDFPNRHFKNGAQSWLAELGLVAIADTAKLKIGGVMFREARVIDTFLWGFDLNPQGEFTIADVTANAPSLWTDPTSFYLSTLNEFYDGTSPAPGNTTTTEYKFSSNSAAFAVVPLPAAIWLFSVGIVVIGGIARRAGKRGNTGICALPRQG